MPLHQVYLPMSKASFCVIRVKLVSVTYASRSLVLYLYTGFGPCRLLAPQCERLKLIRN